MRRYGSNGGSDGGELMNRSVVVVDRSLCDIGDPTRCEGRLLCCFC